MTRCSLFLAGLLALASFPLCAQQAASPAAGGPHQIGLIDMGHIFQNYKKFTAMTEALQKEIEQTDVQAKSIIDRIRSAQEQLQSLKDGSSQFQLAESEMLKAQTELEAFKRTAQRDFLRKEADIYKTVYLEVEDAVRQYAEHYQYSLVLRFERSRVEEAEDPRQILNGMNRHVVFFRSKDDLTDPVLEHLNNTWQNRQSVGRARP